MSKNRIFTCSESDADADDADDSDSESDNLGFLLFLDAIVSEIYRLFVFINATLILRL